MRRNRKTVCLGVLIIQTAIPLRSFSQESSITSRSEDVSEIRFNVADEPLEMAHSGQLIPDRSFAARIRMNSLGNSFSMTLLRKSGFADVQERSQFLQQTVLHPAVSQSSRDSRSPSEFFRALVNLTPKELLPQEDNLAFFLSENVNQGQVHLSWLEEDRATDFEFFIFAPSEQLAKTRAKTFFALLENGIAKPMREYEREWCKSLREEVESHKSRMETSRQAQVQLEKTAEGTEYIDDVELRRLKSERRLLAVEVAGQRARIRAVEKLRNGKGGTAAATKLDDIKMTSEIDVAGLSAQIEALSEVIGLGVQRAELESKIKKLVLVGEESWKALQAAEKRSRDHQALLEAADKLFVRYRDQVTIAPIKWIE